MHSSELQLYPKPNKSFQEALRKFRDTERPCVCVCACMQSYMSACGKEERVGQKSERTKHDQFWSGQRHSNKKKKKLKKRKESRVLTKLKKEVEVLWRGRAGEGRGFVKAVVCKRIREAGKSQKKKCEGAIRRQEGDFLVNKQGCEELLSRLMKDGDAKVKSDIIHPTSLTPGGQTTVLTAFFIRPYVRHCSRSSSSSSCPDPVHCTISSPAMFAQSPVFGRLPRTRQPPRKIAGLKWN